MASTQAPPVGDERPARGPALHVEEVNLVRRPEAITAIPELPRWGKERRRLMMRSGYILLALSVVAAVLVETVDSHWVTAGVTAAVAPGMGFMYDGWPILFVLTWVLYWLAWNLWVGFGSLIHLVGVYVLSIAGSIALADGPRLGLE